jgi:hypothetical protein
MILSACCRDLVELIETEANSYFICTICGHATRTISVLAFQHVLELPRKSDFNDALT